MTIPIECLPATESPTSSNSAAVVVLFHPEGDLVGRLEHIACQVAILIIVANDSLDDRRLVHLDQKKIKYIKPSQNIGLGAALNLGLSFAIDNGYAWCLLMDQDTLIDKNLLTVLAKTWFACPSRQHIGMLVPNYRSPNGCRVAYPTGVVWQNVKTAVTSGSLLSTTAIAKVGGMREDFFIEGIDIEFALRLHSYGLQIVASGQPLMTHGAGVAEERNFFGRTVIITHHPPSRYFLQYRNLIWIMWRYKKQEPMWVSSALASMFKRLCLVLLFERKPISKVLAIIHGISSGIIKLYSNNANQYTKNDANMGD
jgi:rhamnosyltransferase